MTIPNKKKTLQYMDFAKQSMAAANIAPKYIEAFEQHSLNTSLAAKRIGDFYPNLSSEKLETFGLLHDIGRYIPEEQNQKNHSISGYDFMLSKGHNHVARICMTHTFPEKQVSKSSESFFFHDKADIIFAKTFLEEIKYNKYDEIIQLSDFISFHTGFVTIEDRIAELKNRYGNFETQREDALFAIKKKIEKDINASVYKIMGLTR